MFRHSQFERRFIGSIAGASVIVAFGVGIAVVASRDAPSVGIAVEPYVSQGIPVATFVVPTVLVVADEPEGEPADLLPAPFVRYGGFEPGETSGFALNTATRDGLGTTSETSRAGRFAGQALLRVDDPEWLVGYRSEWHSQDTAQLGSERWYGLSYYLPPDWQQSGVIEDSFQQRIVFGFHTAGADPGISPVYGIMINDPGAGSQWRVYRKEGNPGPLRNLWVEPIVTETWVDFVFHVKWTVDETGFIEFYRNGEVVASEYDIRTMTSIAAPSGPYAKWGIHGQPGRILIDEVRIAEGSDLLQLVSPGAALDAEPPPVVVP